MSSGTHKFTAEGETGVETHGIVLNVMFEVGIHHFPPTFSWIKPNHIGSPKCKNLRNKRCVWVLGEQLWPPLQGLRVISSDVKIT